MKLAPWLDAWTEQHCGLQSWVAQMQPLSVYGQRRRRALRPFMPGEERDWDLWRADTLRLHSVCTQADEATDRLWAQFADAPDVTDCVRLLQRAQPLGLEQVAALKRFASLLQAVSDYLSTRDLHLSLWQVTGVDAVLCLCGAPLRAAFSLRDLDDPPLLQAYSALSPLQNAVQEQRQAFTRSLGASYQTPVRRDETLIVAADSPRLADARADARLCVRLETPWEVVFDVVWPSALCTLMEQAEHAKRQVADAEEAALCRLSQRLQVYAAVIARWQESFARLDELSARVWFAIAHDCSWTVRAESVQLVGAVHPAVPKPTPIDLSLLRAVTVLIGPNMGGKTVAQHTLLLLQACHQLGFPIPSLPDHPATYAAPFFKALRYVGGDAQSMQTGLSSFGAEVVAVQSALTCEQALLCLDELGRATNPAEGRALVAAIVSYLGERTDLTALVATHFPIQLSGCDYVRVSGLRVTQDAWPQNLTVEQRIAWLSQAMDYRLLPCLPEQAPQEGLRIAEWIGLTPSVVQRARKLLAEEPHAGQR